MSSSSLKTLTLHAHPGPNPWKIALLLRYLNLPYTAKVWVTADQKKPPFTTELNPNGFTPVLEDPNTGMNIWESGAIAEYILEKYDTEYKLSFEGLAEKTEMRTWMYFQQTFQGPIVSNGFYFTNAKRNDEARERFISEGFRLLAVLEGELKGKDWLVGGRCTAADLMFVCHHQSFQVGLPD